MIMRDVVTATTLAKDENFAANLSQLHSTSQLTPIDIARINKMLFLTDAPLFGKNEVQRRVLKQFCVDLNSNETTPKAFDEISVAFYFALTRHDASEIKLNAPDIDNLIKSYEGGKDLQ